MSGVFDSSRGSHVLTWSEFRKYIDGTYFSGSYSWGQKGDIYQVITEEFGGIRKECSIFVDGGADQLDFENNFKNQSPRTPLNFRVSGSISSTVTGTVSVGNVVQVTGTVGVGGPFNVTGSIGVVNFPLIQRVSGSVSVFTQGAQAVSGTVTAAVTGTVNLDRGNSVANPLFVTGSLTTVSVLQQTVSGSVAVYTQGPQQVSGTVGVNNFPTIQNVSGSVAVYTQGAQLISGSVTVTVTSSLPVTVSTPVKTYDMGVQAVSGSVNTYTQGAQLISGSVQVTGSVATYTHGPQLVSGTVSVTGSVAVYTQGPQQITGTVNITNWPPVHGVTGSVQTYTQGPQLVSGSVSVTGSVAVYTQGPQQVTGTVNITNWPPIHGVTGSVQTYTQGAQLISGTVNVGNWAGVIAVSGSQLTGSTFAGMPVVVGGVSSPGNRIRSLLTDVSGTLFVTGSVGLTDASGREVSVGAVPSGSTAIGNPMQVAGVDTSNQSGTGNIVRNILVDSLGRIITAPAGSNTTNGFVYGTVTTAVVTTVVVRQTTYTEPTANAQRSLSSANAADSAAGTGARQVKITYYDQTMAGPFTETVTLNGTTPVNTVNTNICFIEAMDVALVGSGGQNAGIITLFGSTGGGGGTIGTIAAGDNMTLWAHHYVPNGKTCFITGMTGNNNSNINACIFSIRSRNSGSNQPELLISDTLRQGSTLSQTVRVFGTPLKIVGPARISMFVTSESSANIVNRCSFDFYDQ